MLPQDPVILLSYVNTQLRDRYADFETFCEDLGVDGEEIRRKLEQIDYLYDPKQNQFI